MIIIMFIDIVISIIIIIIIITIIIITTIIIIIIITSRLERSWNSEPAAGPRTASFRNFKSRYYFFFQTSGKARGGRGLLYYTIPYHTILYYSVLWYDIL